VALPRWLRFITDRSQLIIIFGALVMVVAFFGFAELAVEKSAATASYERARDRVEQLRDQNARLKRAVEQADEGQNVAPKAFQYFGQTPPGVTIIVPEEPDIIPSTPPAEPDSAWDDWLVRAQLSVADGIERLTTRLSELAAAAKGIRLP